MRFSFSPYLSLSLSLYTYIFASASTLLRQAPKVHQSLSKETIEVNPGGEIFTLQTHGDRAVDGKNSDFKRVIRRGSAKSISSTGFIHLNVDAQGRISQPTADETKGESDVSADPLSTGQVQKATDGDGESLQRAVASEALTKKVIDEQLEELRALHAEKSASFVAEMNKTSSAIPHMQTELRAMMESQADAETSGGQVQKATDGHADGTEDVVDSITGALSPEDSSTVSPSHMIESLEDDRRALQLTRSKARAKVVTPDSYVETKSLQALRDALEPKIAKTYRFRKLVETLLAKTRTQIRAEREHHVWLSVAQQKWFSEKYPDAVGAEVKFESHMVGTDQKQNYTITKKFISGRNNAGVYLAEGDDGSKVVAKFFSPRTGKEEVARFQKATERLKLTRPAVIPMMVSDRIILDGRPLPCLLMTSAPGSVLFEMDTRNFMTASTELDPAKKMLALDQLSQHIETETVAKEHLLNDPELPKELRRLVETLATNGIWMPDWSAGNIVYDPVLHRATRIDFASMAFCGGKDNTAALEGAQVIWTAFSKTSCPIPPLVRLLSGPGVMEDPPDVPCEEFWKDAPPLSDCSKETLQRHMFYQMTQWHRSFLAVFRSWANKQSAQMFGWMRMRAKEGSELPAALARLSEKYSYEDGRRKFVEGLIRGMELRGNITMPALD